MTTFTYSVSIDDARLGDALTRFLKSAEERGARILSGSVKDRVLLLTYDRWVLGQTDVPGDDGVASASREKTEAQAKTIDCQHEWKEAPRRGDVLLERCFLCGEIREKPKDSKATEESDDYYDDDEGSGGSGGDEDYYGDEWDANEMDVQDWFF